MANAFSIKFPNSLSELSPLFLKLQRATSAICLNSPALATGSSSKKAVKVANTTYAYVEGVLVKYTTAETALAGTVTAAKFNVFVLAITSAGTVTAYMGTEGATIGAVVFPTIPTGSAVLGFVIINPTGTGNFVGASTDLDDATVAPNAVYINTTYPFLPGLETL